MKLTVPQADTADLVTDGIAHAIELLHRNATPHGILAATPGPQAEQRRYTRIFGRDASICALGMVCTDDTLLHENARQGLLTLARHQAENGQIPKYVDTVRDEADFWYLGCIDATLWWLIAVDFFDRQLPQHALAQTLAEPIQRALQWLRCQEHQKLFLLQQNEASDWADIMPRSGFVLYSNALWYHVKHLYGLQHSEETKFHFNHLFFPFSGNMPDYHRLRLLTHYVRRRAGRNDLYLSFVNFSFWGDEGDTFGNLLAILLGLADEGSSHRILRAIDQAQCDQPFPLRVTCKPIGKGHLLWREYMGRHRQNLDYQYHNGGIWPFVGGFWVMALVAAGQTSRARQALLDLAQANRYDDWGFHEWFHGQTGAPQGMRGQSWNAAMFLLANHALQHKVF